MTSNAILGYLNYIKNNSLPIFPIEPMFVYDESLDFSERAIQYITRKGPYAKIEGAVPDKWVILIWSRGSLIKSPTNGRPMEISLPSADDSETLVGISKFRMADLDVTIKLVTNSIEMAEDIEEYLHVLSEETVSFGFTDSIFGDFRASGSPGATTEFEKETTAEFGSVSSVTLNASISFPVILPTREVKDIRVINHEIFTDTVLVFGT